jgi:predicted amidohydrolase YtcJ
VTSPGAAGGPPLLLRGGTVYSPADPFATAMLVDQGAVAWVGGEGAADTAAGPGVVVHHLDGRLVTPAFVDAHAHLTETGLALAGLDLSAARSGQQVLDSVAAAARARPGLPVLGHGWDDTTWTEPRLPTRAELERAAPGAVVYLARVDVHSALVSPALLALLGDVPGLDGGDADGLVRGDAHHAARRASRAGVGPAEREALQRAALQAAAAAGIGQVHEIGAPHVSGENDLALLLEWTRDARVPRVVPYWGELGGIATAQRLGARGCAGDLCVDGSLGSHTAALREPYDDSPGTGVLVLDAQQAAQHVVDCTHAGLQAGFHCIGDAAVDVAVGALAAAAQQCGTAAVQAARHRLEHVEMVDPAQAPVLARLGVVASMQPAFDAAWGGPDGLYVRRLGAERAAGLNPFALLMRAGVTLAFGSDSPVTPFDPWGTVRAAARHHTAQHRISVRGAFAAHTRGGWRAAGRDDAGVLVPAAPADYVLWQVPGDLVVAAPDDRVAAWSTDPRSGVPGLPDLEGSAPLCEATVVAGRVVHGSIPTRPA